MQTLKIGSGKICKIDTSDYGVTIEGPVLIICIKEKDLEETKPRKGQNA